MIYYGSTSWRKKFIGPKEKLTYMHEDPVDFKDLYVPENIHLAYYYILYKGFPDKYQFSVFYSNFSLKHVYSTHSDNQ